MTHFPQTPVNQYRPDIDGLRALAVLAVVLYHAGFHFPGGYVGVDVFFVISGFLITGLILRDLRHERFSILDFWERRARRILPALAVVVLFTLVVGYFLLLPKDFRDCGARIVALAACASNVKFWLETGYFQPAAEQMPLLHTWSLSLEEQFYLIIPVLAWVLFRIGKSRWVFWVLLVLGVGSFVLSAFGVYRDPAATFYLLPARAWELVVGSLVAFAYPVASYALRSAMSWVGLAGILLPILLYSAETRFPGLTAAPPVLGTALLIWAGLRNSATDRLPIVQRCFCLRPFVAVGLISYSLYLWHWPLFAFNQYLSIWAESRGVRFGLLVVSFGLAWLSYRYVEQPFRKGNLLRTRSAVFRWSAATIACLVFPSLMIWKFDGLPKRYTADSGTIIEDVEWKGDEYRSDSDQGVAIGKAVSGPPDFFLWGDSHGYAVAELLDRLATEKELSGIALLSSGLVPVTGLWHPDKHDSAKHKVIELNRARRDRILKSGSRNVLFIGRWDAMIMGMLKTETVEVDTPLNHYKIANHENMELTPENCSLALRHEFSAMLREFAANDIQVWLLLQVPEASSASVARDFSVVQQFPLLNHLGRKWDTTREEYLQRRRLSDEVFSSLKSPNLAIIDPTDNFFGASNRLQLYENRAFYRDEDHLTRAGCDHFLRPTFSRLLDDIASSRAAPVN